MKKRILIPSILMSVMFLLFTSNSIAQATFNTTTTCTGLDPATYSSTTYGGAGSYFDMGSVKITEVSNGDFSPQYAAGTIEIYAPTNFQFRKSGVSVSISPSGDLSGGSPVSYTSDGTMVSFPINATNVNKKTTITITGLAFQCINANTNPVQGIVTAAISGALSINWATNQGITVSLSGLLPVELNSFSGSVSGDVVTLKWSTATEVNNYGFDVQRSTDNETWTKVGFVPGSGNSNSPKNYSFTDQPSGASSFSYRLKQIDVGGAFKYYDAITVTISGDNQAKLLQNSPNPFNPTTTIKYYIPEARQVTLTIYDMLGREVTTLVNQQADAGYHIVYWNGKDRYGESVASGIYLYRLQAGNFVQTKKMIMLK